MTSLERRLGHVETVAREARITAALQMIGARLMVGDEQMGEALDRVMLTSTKEEGLIALEHVLELLDQGERDPAVLDHLGKLVGEVQRMTDAELLDLLARRGRR